MVAQIGIMGIIFIVFIMLLIGLPVLVLLANFELSLLVFGFILAFYFIFGGKK